MSQHATVPSYKAEISRKEQRRGTNSKPTLRAPGLLIPSKDTGHSKQRCQGTSEDDEISPRAESVGPNGECSMFADRGNIVKSQD